MQTSVAAGCFSVGVLWGFRTEEELRDNGANAIVKDPLDVLDLLV
jgi:phosphoglycolate phosphatase